MKVWEGASFISLSLSSLSIFEFKDPQPDNKKDQLKYDYIFVIIFINNTLHAGKNCQFPINI